MDKSAAQAKTAAMEGQDRKAGKRILDGLTAAEGVVTEDMVVPVVPVATVVMVAVAAAVATSTFLHLRSIMT
jgi:hypothetical protein